MPRRDGAPRDLLFGLLALQNGMVTRDQLVAAFRAWTGSPGKALADLLVEQSGLDPARKDLLLALAERHLRLRGGSERSPVCEASQGPSQQTVPDTVHRSVPDTVHRSVLDTVHRSQQTVPDTVHLTQTPHSGNQGIRPTGGGQASRSRALGSGRQRRRNLWPMGVRHCQEDDGDHRDHQGSVREPVGSTTRGLRPLKQTGAFGPTTVSRASIPSPLGLTGRSKDTDCIVTDGQQCRAQPQPNSLGTGGKERLA
jgi:hypothetical protein